MSAYFNYNGNIIKEGTPVISADNRAFRYGDGLFETMKMAGGRIFLSNFHFDRLFSGLSVLGLELPGSFDRNFLEQEILSTCAANNITEPARVRLTVFGDERAWREMPRTAAGFIIQASVLPEAYLDLNENGLTAGIYRLGAKSADGLANLKSNNYLLYGMAANHAKRHQLDDCLVLNASGRVCEATIANVFWIKDNIVYTTPLSEGCVAGVMRRKLLQEFAMAGYEAREKAIFPEQLREADELFFTNALYGMRWVGALDDKRYDNLQIVRLYDRFIRGMDGR
ncbi:MAG TPA: aminotransferase class IV [Flavitalea sp.]|nr:aminotransferase class IV [Flavitalea sp.]